MMRMTRFIKYIDITAFKIIAQVFLNLSNGLIALITMKLTDMKIEIDLRNKHQYLIGIVIASFLFGLWHIINRSIIQVLFTFF